MDALRQLVAKLLVRAERAELTSFTHQDEALRPFVAVLKHCDSAAVREQTVQCIAQAITAHPRGLGSGDFATYLVPDSSIRTCLDWVYQGKPTCANSWADQCLLQQLSWAAFDSYCLA